MIGALYPIVSNGKVYGCEWRLDPLSRHADDVVRKRLKNLPQDKNRKRVALDIGCGTGLRACSLAESGSFDLVIACDIDDRSESINDINRSFARAQHGSGHNDKRILFRYANVLDLKPEDFKDYDIVHVNFRNVLHFLSPQDGQKALKIIRSIVADQAVIAMSFDGTRSDEAIAGLSILNAEEAGNFYGVAYGQDAPYGQYQFEKVIDYMQSLGFTIKTGPVPNEADRWRQEECYVIAYAPDQERLADRPKLGRQPPLTAATL